MCGRFNILADADSLMAAFDVVHDHAQIVSFEPQYNLSPSRHNLELADVSVKALPRVPIVRQNGRYRTLSMAIWPLIPPWSKGVIPKYSTANARCETLTERASYREAWRKKRRCLIPATGFYEWQVVGECKYKQPWHIYHSEQDVMGFAGLWEAHFDRDGNEVVSCAIVTAEANSLMATIHNTNRRMPVIVDPDNRERWLCGDNEDAQTLLSAYPDGALAAHRISKRVNNPLFNHPQCIEPTDTPTRS